jgi:hypothetical protein
VKCSDTNHIWRHYAIFSKGVKILAPCISIEVIPIVHFLSAIGHFLSAIGHFLSAIGHCQCNILDTIM